MTATDLRIPSNYKKLGSRNRCLSAENSTPRRCHPQRLGRGIGVPCIASDPLWSLECRVGLQPIRAQTSDGPSVRLVDLDSSLISASLMHVETITSTHP